jgi:outer membrane protein assembly factor BamE (lipoprotein component of BamABCDE complex)
MTRKLLVLSGVVLAVGAAVPLAVERHALQQRRARGRLIDREHFDRIKKGMSQAEVEAILGGPPGDFTTEPLSFIKERPCFPVPWR